MASKKEKIRGTGSVAKILGMSDEGVRMYEKQGIIKPRKNPETGYRQFDVMNIVACFACRLYRQCGFSLQDMARMVNTDDYSDIGEAYQGRIDELRAELAFQQKLLERMEEIRSLITTIDEDLGKCRIAMRPAMYRYEFIVDSVVMDSTDGDDTISAWLNYTPFAVLSTRYYGKELPPPELGESVSGLGILERDAAMFGVAENDLVKYWPQVKCIYTVVCSNEDMREADFTHVKQYMEREGLTYTGNAIARSIVNTHQNEEFNRYLQIWVPIE